MSSFVHLRCHSAYSLAEGAMHPKALVKIAKANDMPALAVTDTNNLFGALEFAGAAAEAGLQPIIGLQIAISRPGEQRSNGPAKAPDQLVLLAQNEQGYKNLMKLSSQLFLVGATTAEPQLKLADLQMALFV
jgi:DNA polymerase-3 subunit alpha